MRNPTFTVFTGPMFSAKSSRLLAYIDRCKYQKRSVIAFKPRIDKRYGDDVIATHSGGKLPAICVKNGQEIVSYIMELDEIPSVVAVDEVWMIDGAGDALTTLFKLGINIVVSSIDILANGKELKEVQKCMSWATHIEKCPAVCSVCGQDAYYTHMKITDDRDIAIGGEEIYEPRCFQHCAVVNCRPVTA